MADSVTNDWKDPSLSDEEILHEVLMRKLPCKKEEHVVTADDYEIKGPANKATIDAEFMERQQRFLPQSRQVVYVFRCAKSELRNEMVRLAAAAGYFATINSELLTWIMSGAHALMPFGGGRPDWYVFHFVDLTSLKDVESFMLEHKDYFRTSLSKLSLVNYTEMHVIMCMYALLMEKCPNEANYDKWCAEKMKAFAVLLKDPWALSTLVIPYKHAAYINIVMERSLLLRRALFFAIAGATKIELVSRVYRSAMELLKMAKLTGMKLILDFLLNGTVFPILYLDRWLPDRRNLFAALDVWLSYPQAERPYLAIIYDDKDTDALRAVGLERLVYAAWKIACKYYPSWRDFHLPISCDPIPIEKDVEKFVIFQSGQPFCPDKYLPSIPKHLTMSPAEQDRDALAARKEDLPEGMKPTKEEEKELKALTILRRARL
ncbi:hypothetical protein TTRE_0000966401 [Trichuris trichiura]|uniref:Uncharacterized protein n=1 Tax=Trichuris trichiura TaxID=36087 RepID=A0A077ZLK5_TRITR|nr:hypothetical protein TTRE_0000966401 [Trichuris trichiura]